MVTECEAFASNAWNLTHDCSRLFSSLIRDRAISEWQANVVMSVSQHHWRGMWITRRRPISTASVKPALLRHDRGIPMISASNPLSINALLYSPCPLLVVCRFPELPFRLPPTISPYRPSIPDLQPSHHRMGKNSSTRAPKHREWVRMGKQFGQDVMSDTKATANAKSPDDLMWCVV